MNTRRFLTTVWPDKGPYCIATPWVTPDGREVYAHHGCKTIDDAIAYIAVNKQSTDLYFAPHALKVRRELNPATGKMQTFRTHENMREARDFFFDIDVGTGRKKHYATKAAALGALEQFLFETCLPAPFIIDSGYGIHVHWVIDTTLESEAWREPAMRLYWLAQEHRLHVDPMRTTDQSSVLRVPNTFNLKDPANPRKVEILAEGVVSGDFLTQLNDLTEEYDCNTDSAAKSNGHAPGLSVAWDGRYPPADEVAAVCEHMRTFRDSQGNIPEPAWHVGIGTIKHCEDGQDAAHEWSSGYPGYTKEETQAKLDAWALPPPGCEKIDKNSGDPTICARCPYKDLAKNPILIANKVYELKHQQQQPPPGPAPTSIAGVPTPPCQPPRPYILDMTFGIKTKKEGVICTYPMFPVQLVAATANEDALSRWYVKPPRGGWKLISVKNEDLEPRNFAAAFRNKDVIIVNQKHVKQVQTFMRAYMHELQRQQDSFEQFDFVGYNVKREEGKPVEFDDYTHFVMYDRKISVVDGSITPCIMTRNTKLDGMGQQGSLAAQIALMDFYNKPEFMAHQFAIACSLATPFFVYTGQHGVLICLVGETGVSKSTAAFTAASIWGHPERYCISGLATNFTEKARQEREAILRNQPFVVDEITLLPDASVNEIALAASQLGGRGSLKSNREFREERGGYKANLTIATSNTSLVQKINATNPGGLASIMRIFEIKINESDARLKIEADRFMRQLIKNYGWIGEDCLRRCLPSAKALAEKFLEIQYQLEADIKSRPAERFITAAAAIALLGIKLGNKLGYFNYSYKAMREWLINEQIPAIRNAVERERKHMAPETILNEYLETISPAMCRVSKNLRGEVEVIYSPTTTECKARYEIAKGEIYVRLGPFRDYCNERHHDHNSILDHLYKSGPIISKSDRKRMRAEPNTLDNPITCFVISVKSASSIAVPNVPEGRKIVEFKRPER